jgi:hypothetical protein
MRATNAKADHGSSGDYCDALDLCSTLERELAGCRLRLAPKYDLNARLNGRTGFLDVAANCKAAAAHLRNLSQPLDFSKL